MVQVMLIMEKSVMRKQIIKLIKNESNLELIGVRNQENHVPINTTVEPADVIIVETDLTTTKDLKEVIHLQQLYSTTKFLLILHKAEPSIVQEAVRQGITGLLWQQSFPHQLIQAINDIHQGEYVISGNIATMLTLGIKQKEVSLKYQLAEVLQKQNISLPDSRLEVATLLLKGYSTQEIARTLRLQEKTIRSYISDLIQTFDVRKRAQVIEVLNQLINKAS